MSDDHINALKDLMGYADKDIPACRTCRHMKEDEDQAGCWFHTCELNPAFKFRVNVAGRCRFHEPELKGAK